MGTLEVPVVGPYLAPGTCWSRHLTGDSGLGLILHDAWGMSRCWSAVQVSLAGLHRGGCLSLGVCAEASWGDKVWIAALRRADLAQWDDLVRLLMCNDLLMDGE